MVLMPRYLFIPEKGDKIFGNEENVVSLVVKNCLTWKKDSVVTVLQKLEVGEHTNFGHNLVVRLKDYNYWS